MSSDRPQIEWIDTPNDEADQPTVSISRTGQAVLSAGAVREYLPETSHVRVGVERDTPALVIAHADEAGPGTKQLNKQADWDGGTVWVENAIRECGLELPDEKIEVQVASVSKEDTPAIRIDLSDLVSGDQD